MIDYKTARREEARKAGKCTMCMKRKARATKGLLTCGPCSKAAGERRDALVTERRIEAIKSERKVRTITRASGKSTQRGANKNRTKTETKV